MQAEVRPILKAPRSRLVWVLASVIAAALLFVPRLLPDLVMYAAFTAALAGSMLYIGLAGQFSGLSLSRRLGLVLLTVLVMWFLSVLLPSLETVPVSPDSVETAETEEAVQQESLIPPDSSMHLRDSIDRLSMSSRHFFSDVMTIESAGPFSEILGVLGDATGATAGVFVETVFSASNIGYSDSIHQAAPERLRNPRLLLITLSGAASAVLLLVLLRGLVMVDRKGSTLRTFRVLVILVFLQVFYVALGLENLAIMSRTYIVDLQINIPYVLVILWAVVNGFRNKWINYLNRSSKYLLLLGSGVVAVLSWNILQDYMNGQLTMAGVAAGTLWGTVATVITIYSGMAFISLLMQLPAAKLLDKKFNELRTLQGLSQIVHSTINRERLSSIAVDLGRNLIGADLSWIVLLRKDSGFELKAASGTDAVRLEGLSDDWYRSLMDRLVNSNGCLLLNNFPRSQLGRTVGKGFPRTGSLIASIIELQGEKIGFLLSAGTKQFAFTDDIREVYSTFARQVAVAFSTSRLIESSIERERLEEELSLARGIQMSLLPAELPVIKGYDISAISVPSRKVGGDFYDTIHMADGRYAIAIADVAGKGASAALLMAALQAGLHALLEDSVSVTGIVTKLNQLAFNRMPEDKFITFFLGFLDPAEHTFTYCSAGHDYPLLVRSDGSVVELDHGGLVLGVLERVDYEHGKVSFHPGDRLILYTDGITETFDSEGKEEFGRERLLNILRNHPSFSASELLERVIYLVDSYRGDSSQADDMTLVIVTGLEDNV